MVNKHFSLLSSGFCTQVVLNDLFLGPNNRKSTFFAYFFEFHLRVLCLIAKDCVGQFCGNKYGEGGGGVAMGEIRNGEIWHH